MALRLPPHSYNAFTTDARPAPNGTKLGRVVVIVNPASGKRAGLRALEMVTKRCEKAGVEVRPLKTERAGHATELARNEDLSGVDAVLSVGGDGTLCEVVNGLMSRPDKDETLKRVALGIIPAGSGNTVAYSMGVYSVDAALDTVLRGLVRDFDVMGIASLDKPNEAQWYGLNVAGWALPSAIMRTANWLRCLGCGALYTPAIYSYILQNKSFQARISYIDDKGEKGSYDGDVAHFSVTCTVHVGTRTPVAPDAKLDDGFLDLTIVRRTGVVHNLLTMSLAEKGKHVGRVGVVQVRVSEVTLEPLDDRLRGKDTLNLDGEMTGTTPCRIFVLKGALMVLSATTPAGAVVPKAP